MTNPFESIPLTELSKDKVDVVREHALTLYHNINLLCPNSREKSLAITNLEQAIMWTNRSIAFNQE